ncbi:unnamed protein product [Ostreobium quekettii]|uniref:BUB1 N-terminal domain-containing protein n=1 Tax=Ostreobium quekettii TaxID=121088 RepID=A0A8S1J519_9CHLO|nr:unnamed protein product [Ostreobium quekettii]
MASPSKDGSLPPSPQPARTPRRSSRRTSRRKTAASAEPLTDLDVTPPRRPRRGTPSTCKTAPGSASRSLFSPTRILDLLPIGARTRSRTSALKSVSEVVDALEGAEQMERRSADATDSAGGSGNQSRVSIAPTEGIEVPCAGLQDSPDAWHDCTEEMEQQAGEHEQAEGTEDLSHFAGEELSMKGLAEVDSPDVGDVTEEDVPRLSDVPGFEGPMAKAAGMDGNQTVTCRNLSDLDGQLHAIDETAELVTKGSPGDKDRLCAESRWGFAPGEQDTMLLGPANKWGFLPGAEDTMLIRGPQTGPDQTPVLQPTEKTGEHGGNDQEDSRVGDKPHTTPMASAPSIAAVDLNAKAPCPDDACDCQDAPSPDNSPAGREPGLAECENHACDSINVEDLNIDASHATDAGGCQEVPAPDNPPTGRGPTLAEDEKHSADSTMVHNTNVEAPCATDAAGCLDVPSPDSPITGREPSLAEHEKDSADSVVVEDMNVEGPCATDAGGCLDVPSPDDPLTGREPSLAENEKRSADSVKVETCKAMPDGAQHEFQTMQPFSGGLKRRPEVQTTLLELQQRLEAMQNRANANYARFCESRKYQRMALVTPAEKEKRRQWDGCLDQYVHARRHASEHPQRLELKDRIFQDPTNPKAWMDFIAHEEALEGAQERSGEDCENTVYRGPTITSLYTRAVVVVPREGHFEDVAFFKLWLGLARRHWLAGDIESAGATFCSMEMLRIGQKNARLYVEWATMVYSSGTGKAPVAEGIVERGLAAGATPRGELESLQAKLRAHTVPEYTPYRSTPHRLGAGCRGASVIRG